MKILFFYLCLCAISTFAQENVGASTETDSESDSFVDQLLKSLYVATADDAVSSNVEITNSTMPITTTTASTSSNVKPIVSLPPITFLGSTELPIAKNGREDRGYSTSIKNVIPNTKVLNDFIQKLATIQPETFDRLLNLLNQPTSDQQTTEVSIRSGFARNDMVPSTSESNTPMLFTSEIEDTTPETTTQDLRISDIISIISNVASNTMEQSSQSSTETVLPETTTQEPVITVLPIMTFENSSSGSVIIFGPYAPPLPSNQSNIKTTTSLPTLTLSSTLLPVTTTTTTEMTSEVNTTKYPTTPSSTENIFPVTTTTEIFPISVNTTDNPTFNRAFDDINNLKPYPNVIDSYKPDFYVFGVLPNGTIVRKRPTIINPSVVIGVLPNDTLVQKFPNGSTAPLPTESVIQVNGFDTRDNPIDVINQQRSLNMVENNDTATIVSRFSNESYIATPEVTLEEPSRNESEFFSTTIINSTEVSVETTGTTVSSTSLTTNLTEEANKTSDVNLATTEAVLKITPDEALNSLSSVNEDAQANALAISPVQPSSPITLMNLLTNNVSIITASIVKNVTQNMRLNEKQKQDLALIESLLKKQQLVLEQLASITKMNLETTSTPMQENLTERVMAKVMEMSTNVSTTTLAIPERTTLTSTVPALTSTTENKISNTQPTPIKIKNQKRKQAIITEKQIELLISQLEAIKKNPEKVKKLDIDALRKLQKFENSVQNADDIAIMEMIKMNVKMENDTKGLSGRFNNAVDASTATTSTSTTSTTTTTSITTTTSTTPPPFTQTTTMTTIQRPTTSVTSKTSPLSSKDPKMREELLDYAINISQAISSFLGTALQEASLKFVKSLANSKSILKLDGVNEIKNIPSA